MPDSNVAHFATLEPALSLLKGWRFLQAEDESRLDRAELELWVLRYESDLRPSRKAAQECSPRRKPCGKQAKESASSEGAKETCLTRLAILSCDWVFSKVPHGLRRGLHSFAASRLLASPFGKSAAPAITFFHSPQRAFCDERPLLRNQKSTKLETCAKDLPTSPAQHKAGTTQSQKLSPYSAIFCL